MPPRAYSQLFYSQLFYSQRGEGWHAPSRLGAARPEMLAPDRDALAVRRAERQIDAPVRGAGSARDDGADGAVDVRLRIVPRQVLAVPLSPASGRSVLPAAAAPAAAAPASRGLGRASARRRRAGGERARRPPPRSCAAPLACRAAPVHSSSIHSSSLHSPRVQSRASVRSGRSPTRIASVSCSAHACGEMGRDGERWGDRTTPARRRG